MSLFGKKRNYDTHFAPQVDKAKAEDFSKTFSESFMDDWHFQTYTGNSYSKTANLHDEYEKEIESIKKQTGKELKNPYNSAFEEFITEDIGYGLWDELVKNPFSTEAGYYDRRANERRQKRIDKYHKDLEKLKQDFPDLQFRDDKTIEDDIKKQAQEYYRKVNDNRDNSGLGSFLGSAAGSMVDPINFFTSLVSGGAGTAKQGIMKALGKTAAKEFVNNAAVESLIQPSVYKYKQELEIPYSKEEAVMNVAAAGFGGAALGTAGKALHLSGKEVLSRYKKAAASGVKFDANVKADADFLEKKIQLNDWLDETNPYGDTLEGRILHEKSIEEQMRRMTDETGELSKAYDNVLANPKGEPDDPIVLIEPEDMEKVWIERGSMKPYNGDSKHGYGLVKFIFKHGEESSDKIKIVKEDVVNFPKIIREYEPIQLSEYGNHRIWSIKKADGTQIIYSDSKWAEDGRRHLITIHAVEPEQKSKIEGVFSERRRTQPIAHTEDTAQKPYYQHKESSANASAPESRFPDGGNVTENIISPDDMKVKDFSEIDADTFKKELDAMPDLTPDERKLNNETIEKFKQEDGWDDQIIECITEFGKK